MGRLIKKVESYKGLDIYVKATTEKKETTKPQSSEGMLAELGKLMERQGGVDKIKLND